MYFCMNVLSTTNLSNINSLSISLFIVRSQLTSAKRRQGFRALTKMPGRFIQFISAVVQWACEPNFTTSNSSVKE